MVGGTAGYMLATAGYMVVAHVIIVSPQSQFDLDFYLRLGLGLGGLDLGLGLDNYWDLAPPTS